MADGERVCTEDGRLGTVAGLDRLGGRARVLLDAPPAAVELGDPSLGAPPPGST